VTVCLVGLMAFVALAIDVGMMAVARTQAQAAADIAALAGARTLDGTPGNNRLGAEEEARDTARNNAVLASQITDAQITSVKSGVYRYNVAAAEFDAILDTEPVGNEAYGLMQVILTVNQDTFFGKVLGVNVMQVSARATAVHRPRDIAISLDFSGSMRFSSQFNYPSATAGTNVTGGLNPDDRFPRFGPWKLYPVATSFATSNPMHFGGSAYVDSGGEAHAANNLTMETRHGPAIVANFQVNAGTAAVPAFAHNGDLNATSFDINNTPVCTPAPASWSSEYAAGYKGDRWPLKSGVLTTAPAVTDYAKHVADLLFNPIPAITNSTRLTGWEQDGYDMLGLTFANSGGFQGYSMGPGYYGKTFYMWPPDPRWTNGADPTTINTAIPIQDSSGRYMADWRKRFFLYPSGSPSTKGAPLDDNSRLWNSSGIWRNQQPGGSALYVPNYDAILAWLKSGPQTLPPSLRIGRVLYYDAIPNAIPMNWETGVIASSATINERFWKEYIDFVLGAGRHDRNKTLYGDDTNNTWGGQTFGTTKITPRSSLTGNPPPYMHYADTPVHPRLHTWFGPLTMMGFLAADTDVMAYNWFAGTTAEAQTWQLKAGIRSALDDIRRNHPNDLATMNFWSSHNGYNSPRVTMGKDFEKMRNCLYYPYSLVGDLGTVSSEKRPYRTANPSNSNPCGLNDDNYGGDIPNGDGGTNPSMGLMNSYNQFNWVGSYTGRNGASKIVILETDGVANQRIQGSFNPIGTGGRFQWTGIANGGSAPSPSNGHPDALNPAISLAWLLCQDVTGSKPWPTFPAYTNGTGLATAGAPTKWGGITNNGPGYSSMRNQARIHTLAFGELFEPTTTSNLKIRALQFLRNVQIAGGTSPPGASSIESYKIITGTSAERIDKLREALERIMQAGIQVALIE
jgi:hypothetical protein